MARRVRGRLTRFLEIPVAMHPRAWLFDAWLRASGLGGEFVGPDWPGREKVVVKERQNTAGPI